MLGIRRELTAAQCGWCVDIQSQNARAHPCSHIPSNPVQRGHPSDRNKNTTIQVLQRRRTHHGRRFFSNQFLRRSARNCLNHSIAAVGSKRVPGPRATRTGAKHLAEHTDAGAKQLAADSCESKKEPSPAKSPQHSFSPGQEIGLATLNLGPPQAGEAGPPFPSVGGSPLLAWRATSQTSVGWSHW